MSVLPGQQQHAGDEIGDELDFGEDELYVAPPPTTTTQHQSSKSQGGGGGRRDEELEDVVSLPPSPTSNSPANDSTTTNGNGHGHARPSTPIVAPSPPLPTPPAPAPAPVPQKRKHDPKLDEHGQPLPPGWTSRVSSANDIYYKEEATGKSEWDIPQWPKEDQRARTRSPELPKKVDDHPAPAPVPVLAPAPAPTSTTSATTGGAGGRLAVHPDRLKLVAAVIPTVDSRSTLPSLPSPLPPNPDSLLPP
ncbi:hypothetical protein RQP46_005846 [Phenoliferia psychrophenolica]